MNWASLILWQVEIINYQINQCRFIVVAKYPHPAMDIMIVIEKIITFYFFKLISQKLVKEPE